MGGQLETLGGRGHQGTGEDPIESEASGGEHIVPEALTEAFTKSQILNTAKPEETIKSEAPA